MSVMMQSHEPCALAARNSSADANPRTPYASEPSDSTSAVRNGSSSSMTAIRGSLDTHHPFPRGLASRLGWRGERLSHVTEVPGHYTGVLFPTFTVPRSRLHVKVP